MTWMPCSGGHGSMNGNQRKSFSKEHGQGVDKNSEFMFSS